MPAKKRKRPAWVASFSGLIETGMSNKQLLCSLSLSSLAASSAISMTAFGAITLAALSAVSLAAYSSAVLAALFLCAFVAALVAAAHCSKCNSYDKKHFLHNYKIDF